MWPQLYGSFGPEGRFQTWYGEGLGLVYSRL